MAIVRLPSSSGIKRVSPGSPLRTPHRSTRGSSTLGGGGGSTFFGTGVTLAIWFFFADLLTFLESAFFWAGFEGSVIFSLLEGFSGAGLVGWVDGAGSGSTGGRGATAGSTTASEV